MEKTVLATDDDCSKTSAVDSDCFLNDHALIVVNNCIRQNIVNRLNNVPALCCVSHAWCLADQLVVVHQCLSTCLPQQQCHGNNTCHPQHEKSTKKHPNQHITPYALTSLSCRSIAMHSTCPKPKVLGQQKVTQVAVVRKETTRGQTNPNNNSSLRTAAASRVQQQTIG